MRGGASLSNINLGQTMQSLEVGREIASYTGVIVHAGQDASGNTINYSAGDSTGYVLEVDNPIGTQQMADCILAGLRLRGISYKPYDASNSPLDPSAELGDSVTVNGADSVILGIDTNHSKMMAADVSAPFDEEVDHEFAYVSKMQREFTRESAYARSRISQTESAIELEVVRATDAENALESRITLTESEIEAKVSKTGGNASSFGWTLTDSSWTLNSNGSVVFRATSTGVDVVGNITATSGTIGGVVIANGVLSGITDTNIAVNGISGGSGGSISGGGITTYNTTSGINTNLGYGAAYGAATVQGTASPASFFTTYGLAVRSTYMSLNGQACQLLTRTIDGTTIHYIGYA